MLTRHLVRGQMPMSHQQVCVRLWGGGLAARLGWGGCAVDDQTSDAAVACQSLEGYRLESTLPRGPATPATTWLSGWLGTLAPRGARASRGDTERARPESVWRSRASRAAMRPYSATAAAR